MIRRYYEASVMRTREASAYHGNRSIPQGHSSPSPQKAIAVLRAELKHSGEVLTAALDEYQAALRRYLAALEAQFTGKH